MHVETWPYLMLFLSLSFAPIISDMPRVPLPDIVRHSKLEQTALPFDYVQPVEVRPQPAGTAINRVVREFRRRNPFERN